MKKSGLAFMTLGLLLVFFVMVSAEGKRNCEGMGGGMMEEKMFGPRMILAMASELNLTTEQMEKLKKITDNAPEKGAAKDEMEKQRTQMQDEMKKDNPDQTKIDAMIDDMAKKHKEAVKERIKVKQAVDAVLTPAQKEILKKKMEEKKGKIEKHMKKMK